MTIEVTLKATTNYTAPTTKGEANAATIALTVTATVGEATDDTNIDSGKVWFTKDEAEAAADKLKAAVKATVKRSYSLADCPMWLDWKDAFEATEIDGVASITVTDVTPEVDAAVKWEAGLTITVTYTITPGTGTAITGETFGLLD